MAMTPEQRIVNQLKAFAQNGGNSEIAGFLFGHQADISDMSRVLDLLLSIVRQLARLDNHVTTPEKTEVIRKARVITSILG